MNTTPEHDAGMAKLTFAEVYPHYIAKVERKGRTKKDEKFRLFESLTGELLTKKSKTVQSSISGMFILNHILINLKVLVSMGLNKIVDVKIVVTYKAIIIP